MNTDVETIENYLTGQLTPGERLRFEETLRTDPAAADALAFYLLTKQIAREEAHEQRKAELNALREQPIRALWRAPMRWAAAASVVLVLGLGWYFWVRPASAPVAGQLADQYIAAHFTQLPTTMDGGPSGSTSMDSLKLGIGLFNKGELAAAETVFLRILTRHPDTDSALKFAGIVSLRQEHYDQAIDQFHRLSQRTELFANPGTFYEALARLKRAQPLDKQQAKKLLNEVISKNLAGKREAELFVNEIP